MVVTYRVRIAYITTEKPYVIALTSHMLRIRHTHSYHCIFDRVQPSVCMFNVQCTYVRKAKTATIYATNYWNEFVNLCSFRLVYNNKFCYFAISHRIGLLKNDEMKSNEINFDVGSLNSCKKKTNSITYAPWKNVTFEMDLRQLWNYIRLSSVCCTLQSNAMSIQNCTECGSLKRKMRITLIHDFDHHVVWTISFKWSSFVSIKLEHSFSMQKHLVFVFFSIKKKRIPKGIDGWWCHGLN